MFAKIFTVLLFILDISPIAFGQKSSTHSTGLLGDRLIVEIDGRVFTQSEVESHFVLAWSLRNAPKSKLLELFKRENWGLTLDQFAEDMVIFSEAKRLGSFHPNESMTNTARTLYQKKRDKNLWLENMTRRLGMTNKLVNKLLYQFLTIESFRRSKSPTEQKSNWVEPLRQRRLIRYFEGALAYRDIQPTLGKQPDAL